jgi:hypothetical protein
MATSVEKPMITDVERAFALGWQLAELFHSPVHQSPVEYGEAGNRLPGISELAPPNRSVLLARQIESGILVLHLPDQPNDPPPSSKEVENLLRADPPRSRTEVRQAILELHINILETLTVADFRLGKAYGLGRALAETVIVPAEAEAVAQRVENELRSACCLCRSWKSGPVVRVGKRHSQRRPCDDEELVEVTMESGQSVAWITEWRETIYRPFKCDRIS